MEVGLRVVRGPDWDLDDSESECDGGEGFVGTVVEVGGKSSRLPENLVWVQWDSGVHKDHRAGYHKAFDLCVLDSSTIGIEHSGTKCQSCDQTPILGIRWECVDCTPIYNLCTACYMADEHEKSHNFKRIDSQGQEGIPVGKRSGTQKIQASGIFPGAKVMRGPDWELGAEDGGKGREGVVLKITNWDYVPKAGVVVSWDHGDKTTCRLGVDGKVDLKCVSPGAGGFYYKSHLPKLGENHPTGQTKRRHDRQNLHGKSRKNKRLPPAQKKPVKQDKPVQVVKPAVHVMRSESSKTSVCESSQETLGESSMANSSDFKIGESVCVALDEDVVKQMNTKFDMWRDATPEYIGKKGTLHSFSNNGGVNIVYPDKTLWTFSPDLVSKADQHYVYPDAGAVSREPNPTQPQLKCGDYVKILDDEDLVRQLQESHGPWEDSFCKVLGQTGRIFRLNSTGDVEVIVGPRGDENVITFNPAVLSLSSADVKEEDEKHQPDVGVYADSQEMDDHSKAAALLSGAAGAGDLPVVEAVLERYPDVIDHLDQGGHTALHNACHHGHFEVVAFLVEKGSNKELKDWQGYTALHHAAYCDRSGQTAYFLVLGGAHIDENQNEYGTTPLHLSIKEYNTETAKVLIQAGCNVNLPELDGFTALALAILHGNTDVVESLLDSPDLLLDLAGCPPFYSALTGKDCPETVKAIIQRFPEIASLPLNNDMTPLHVAALYNNVALAKFLLEKGECDLNLKNKSGLTPIKLAHMAGSESVMELMQERTYLNQQTSVITPDQQSLVAAIRSELSNLVSKKVSRRKTFERDFKFGDKVQVLGNRALIEAYQIWNGGWVDTMETVLSKFGHVEEVLENGNIRVRIQDPTVPLSLVFNSLCLDPVEEDQQDSESRLVNYYESNSYSPWTEGASGAEVSDPLMRDFVVNRSLEGLIASVQLDSSELNRSRDPELYRGLMYVAVAMGCTTKIKRIIENCQQALFPLENVPPPLHMGCANGDFEVVEVLLEGGADVNLKEEPVGFAPLHYAAVGDGTGRVTDMLLRGGADVNDNVNDLVVTPLHLAVAYGNDIVASKIIQAVGYDFSLKDSQEDTPLSRAVYCGREIIVELLLALGIKCDLNSYNKQGFNVLHMAAMEGNEKPPNEEVLWAPHAFFTLEDAITNTVLDSRSCTSINSLTRDGRSMTPLHLACYKGHAAVARLLLEKGCSFRLRNGNGRIPLEVASIARNHAVVSVLIEWHEGVKEEGRGKPIDDFPPVFCAGDVVKIRSNREVVTILQQGMSDCNIVELQLQGKEGNVLTVDDQGNVELTIPGYDRTWTLNPWAVECIRHLNPSSSVTRYQEAAIQKKLEKTNTGEPQWQSELIQAVCTSHLSRIKSTILKNPNAVKQKLRGTTLLHLAARNGAIHIMEELLDHNADVNAQDIRQRTPLHVAAAKDRTGSAASLLLERRADPNVQGFDDYKRTPLHLAVCRNNYAAAKVLIEHKDCNVNLQDSHGDSPLHCAIDQEKEKLIELIVKSRDCNPRLPNENPMGHHYNALHLAAVRRNVSVASIVHEVCPEIVEDVDFQGNTALHLAAMHGSKEVADYLLRKGNCNIRLKNNKGETAFEAATSNGHLEVQKLFPEYKDVYRPVEGDLSLQQSSGQSLNDQDNGVMQAEPEFALSYADLDGKYGCISQAQFASCYTNGEKTKITERTADAKGKISVPETVKQISLSGASADDHGSGKHNESLQQDRKTVSEKENQTFCVQAPVSEPDLEKTDSMVCPVKRLSEVTCPHSNSETGMCAKCQEAKAEGTCKGNHQAKILKKEEHDNMLTMTEKTKHFAREEEVHPTQDLPHPILAGENSGNTFEKEQKGLSTWQTTETVLPTPPMCIKCQEKRASVTFRPCGHKVTCEGCSHRAKKCVKCCSSVAEKVSELNFQDAGDKKEKLDNLNIPKKLKKTEALAVGEERHQTRSLPHSTLVAENERHTLDRKQIEPSTRQSTKDIPTPPMCVKCDTRRASVIFQPCGHKVTCERCSFSVKKCVICSYPVAEKVLEH